MELSAEKLAARIQPDADLLAPGKYNPGWNCIRFEALLPIGRECVVRDFPIEKAVTTFTIGAPQKKPDPVLDADGQPAVFTTYYGHAEGVPISYRVTYTKEDEKNLVIDNGDILLPYRTEPVDVAVVGLAGRAAAWIIEPDSRDGSSERTHPCSGPGWDCCRGARCRRD